jgi:hypothetical protein
MLNIRFGHYFAQCSTTNPEDEALLRHLGNQAYRVAYRAQRSKTLDPYANISAEPGTNVGSKYYLEESTRQKRTQTAHSGSSKAGRDPLDAIWNMFDTAKKIGDSMITSTSSTKPSINGSSSSDSSVEPQIRFRPPSLRKSYDKLSKSAETKHPDNMTTNEQLQASSSLIEIAAVRNDTSSSSATSEGRVLTNKYDTASPLKRSRDPQAENSSQPKKYRQDNHDDMKPSEQPPYNSSTPPNYTKWFSKFVFPYVKAEIDPIWHSGQGQTITKEQYKDLGKTVTEAVLNIANANPTNEGELKMIVKEQVRVGLQKLGMKK